MASAFRSANHADDMSESASDPPKPLDAASAATNPQNPSSVMDDATTPTRATFRNSGDAAAAIIAASGSAALASQKPLPTSPFPQAVQVPEPSEKTLPKRENSQHSRKSGDSEDVDMNDSDAEDGAGDDAGSDDDSVNADGTKSKNKKKSQRFYCTDYPPCNLSFTRSEHLARHIRYVADPAAPSADSLRQPPALPWHWRMAQLTPRTPCPAQETHGREAIPVPLFSQVFAARQPPTARPDCPRQRRYSGGFPCRRQHPFCPSGAPRESSWEREGKGLNRWERRHAPTWPLQIAVHLEHHQHRLSGELQPSR